MGDDITIGVTEIVNNIKVTAQPNDQIVDISVIDNTDEVTLNITPTVIEINVNKGSSYAKWGTILGTLSDQEDLQDALDLKANLVDGKVPASELPSYVDDVIEVADYASLPVTGEIGKIYITLDDNKIYRWSGSIYIEIASNNAIWGAITGTLSNQLDLQAALDAKQSTLVSGTNIKTLEGQSLLGSGNIDLTKSDVGLSNVDNTSDLDKPISTATQTALDLKADDNEVVKLTTDQSIAGVKTFTSLAKFTNDSGALFAIEIDTITSDALVIKDTGTTKLQIGKNGEILAAKYKISGGFNTQFLKANGDLDNTVYTPASRTITINGVTQDLTANRSFTVPTHNPVGIGTSNGLSIDSNQSLSLALASSSTNGALSSTDWNTFNNKQDALTNPITGSLTTNYLPKATGATTLGNSLIYDDGTNVGIGTTSPVSKLTTVNTGNLTLNSNDGDHTGFGLYVQAPSTTNSISSAIGFGVGARKLAAIAMQSYADADQAGLNFYVQPSATGSAATLTEAMRINSNGNVGIGVVPETWGSLNTALQLGLYASLYDSSGSTILGFNTYNDGTANKYIATGSLAMRYIVNGSGHIWETAPSGTADANITYTERMRITSGGFTKMSNSGSYRGVSSEYHEIVSNVATQNAIIITNSSATNPYGPWINFSNSSLSGTSTYFLAGSNTAGDKFFIWSNGSIVNATGSYGTISDIKYKENIIDATSKLDDILQLKVRNFNFIGEESKQIGFIAQEFEEVFPNMIDISTERNEDGEEGETYKSIKTSVLTPILVKAMQELAEQVKDLKAEIELLKAK